MLSFAAPAWLLGLLLAPVIRWLHRGGRPRAAVPVARAAMWRAAPAEWPAEGARQPPDPAWRRRALLAALLALALAGPQWPLPQTRITLWVDDAPGMLTREVGGTRLALGLAQARTALAALPGAEVEWRRLSAPWRSRAAGDSPSAASAPPAPPPAALLKADRMHWLVTDGTHSATQVWPGGQRPARVLRVGSVTRNVGITSVAARRPEGDAAFVDLRVRLTNGGDSAETRELLVAGEGGAAQRLSVSLAAGATETRQLRLPRASRLQLRLTPGDALPEDDEAALDLAAFVPLPVRVEAACPPALRAAVAAHPGLAEVPTGERMQVACSSASAAVPVLRWLGDQLPTPVSGTPQWAAELPAARQVPLAPERLRATARPALSTGARVLLAADGQPLMVLRSGPQPVLDMALDAASLGPDLPLLLDFAAEQLMSRSLLDPVAVLDRGTAAARVVPGAVPTAEASATTPASAQADGTAWLLWPALLLLVWEIVILARRWRDAAVAFAELPQ